MSSILDTLKNLIPSNPIAAFADGNMLQVLVFALIIGFTLIAVGEKGTPFLNLIDSINEVCLKIITTIMYFTSYRLWKPTELKRSFPLQHSLSFCMWHSLASLL